MEESTANDELVLWGGPGVPHDAAAGKTNAGENGCKLPSAALQRTCLMETLGKSREASDGRRGKKESVTFNQSERECERHPLALSQG